MLQEKKRTIQWLNKVGMLLLAMILVMGLAACGNTDGEQASSSPTATTQVPAATQQPEASPTAEAKVESPGETVYPLTIVDGTGSELVLEKAPERIITLAPSETEIAFAIGAGDFIVGVDDYSDFPEEAKSKAKIGDMNTNVESVIALKPDVVLAHSGLQLEVINKLRELGVKVYADDPKTITAVINKIETVGIILNKQQEAKQVTDGMQADIDLIATALKDAPIKKVYLEFSPGWSVGKGEYLDELVQLAKGINIVGDQVGWFEINAEQVITADPEVVLYGVDAYMGNSIYDEIMKRPGFDGITAVKNKALYPIDSNLVSRVGPRLSKGLVEVAKAIHPDLVKE